MTPKAGFVEDANGKKSITTSKRAIAENCFFLKGKPFSLDAYPMLHSIYESTAKFTVILSGRQVSKSTTAANFMTAENIGMPHWESIAVLPSIMQMRRFSNLRVGKLIGESPIIKKWFMDASCRRNVTERSFNNGSAMYFGALSQIESLRGLSANRILEDEVQDMASDDLPIVEESLSGQASDRQFILRTGTAKTVGNLLETTYRESTMCEWIVICPANHHNIPDEDNIEIKGFTCKKCKELCDVRNGYWRAFKRIEDAKWLGFRIPQIILPMHAEDPEKWAEIVYKRHNLAPITFMNEVMGRSGGSGIDFLSEDDLRACCEPQYSPHEICIPADERYHVKFATVDWGLTARRSYTIVSIWGITPEGRMKLLHCHRFVQNDPFKQVERIAHLVIAFGVNVIGVDWGAGFMQSLHLEQLLRRPVHRFMYVGEQAELIKWDKESTLWKVNRTQAMTETFMRMRDKSFWFPEWNFFKNFAKDILSIFMEPVDDKVTKNDKIRYDHPADSPDDFAHTCVYAQLLYYLLVNHKL